MQNNSIYLFEFSNKLNQIFEYLNKNNIKPIVVGGFVRDTILGVKKSKDIDIEVYGVESFEKLATLLKPFGKSIVVGKSFCVLKLKLEGEEYDFSLPRRESKVAKGHKGFLVDADATLSFSEAARRRDFTINAMGWDPKEGCLLDPFGGMADIAAKRLHYVDKERFAQDPLRPLRGVVFAARFCCSFSDELFNLSAKMLKEGAFDELSKERVYEELLKLLEAEKPSIALKLLKALGLVGFFKPLSKVDSKEFDVTCDSLDRLQKHNQYAQTLFFALLVFPAEKQMEFLQNFTAKKKLHKNIELTITAYKQLQKLLKSNYKEFEVLEFATMVNIAMVVGFAYSRGEIAQAKLQSFYALAKKLGVEFSPKKPLVDGKMLVELGLEPSKEFGELLQKLYAMQLRGSTKEELVLFALGNAKV